MGCTETKSDDDDYGESNGQRGRNRPQHNYQEDDEGIEEDEEEFKDFEELVSKNN